MLPVLSVSRKRLRPLSALLLASAAAVGLRLLAAAPVFIPGCAPTSIASGLRKSSSLTVRKAEGEEGDGGFLKFLKVEQDIELSPEEYKIALEQEIESQRKRYYIGGEIKENNLIVPWKPVDEKQLEQDARRALKKNGIVDPEGGAQVLRGEGADQTQDSLISAQIVGEQDVLVEWTAGEPGTKVGYIVERKRPSDANFREIASYEQPAFANLLAQPYAGHEYTYTDEIVKPGPYSYRVLVRFRSGEVSVVDQKDVTVPELSGVDSGAALIVFVILAVSNLVYSYFSDPIIT